MQISDRELSCAAAMVRKRHGDMAPAHICGRIAALERAGDIDGADLWVRILERFSEQESCRVGSFG